MLIVMLHPVHVEGDSTRRWCIGVIVQHEVDMLDMQQTDASDIGSLIIAIQSVVVVIEHHDIRIDVSILSLSYGEHTWCVDSLRETVSYTSDIDAATCLFIHIDWECLLVYLLQGTIGSHVDHSLMLRCSRIEIEEGEHRRTIAVAVGSRNTIFVGRVVEVVEVLQLTSRTSRAVDLQVSRTHTREEEVWFHRVIFCRCHRRFLVGATCACLILIRDGVYRLTPQAVMIGNTRLGMLSVVVLLPSTKSARVGTRNFSSVSFCDVI